jgi:hypothetical protein
MNVAFTVKVESLPNYSGVECSYHRGSCHGADVKLLNHDGTRLFGSFCLVSLNNGIKDYADNLTRRYARAEAECRDEDARFAAGQADA